MTRRPPSLSVTFPLYGLTFNAEVDYEHLVPARISGPPEDSYPAEGGSAEITALSVDGADAIFLMGSDLSFALNEAAYEACLERIAFDHEDALESRAQARADDRRYG